MPRFLILRHESTLKRGIRKYWRLYAPQEPEAHHAVRRKMMTLEARHAVRRKMMPPEAHHASLAQTEYSRNEKGIGTEIGIAEKVWI